MEDLAHNIAYVMVATLMGIRLDSRHVHDEINITRVYQTRPQRFEHNYQRDKFMANRDRYCMVSIRADRFNTIKLSKPESVEIYYDAIKKIAEHINVNPSMLLKKVEAMLKKMNDSVEVKDSSPVREFDYENGRRSYEGRGRFNEV